ncbi:MAG TPA: hydrogenase nickel incorporation protein HypB [Polyangia bacterium]|nr:hydrogenase nickel incorporation protein HypB [Polyangia bacterium]
MCATCGCSETSHDHDGEQHHHDHDHHHHDHPRVRLEGVTVRLEQKVLEKNRRRAERNRAWFDERSILALDLVSSPGAGKTSLLERTIRDLGRDLAIYVVEGDQATENDAARIRAAGARAVQINTGTGCHLDAEMVARALVELEPPRGALCLIENVGNLVCPALFPLGEHAKVVTVSVTEGDDKPIKYPHMFRAAELMIVNKIDLLPYVQFDVERCVAHARAVNPRLGVLRLSATRGDGLDGWYDWLKTARAAREVEVRA